MATHLRIPPRPRAARASTWWGKAWARAVEEAAYGDAELRRGRTLARAGRVGAITLTPGRFVAAVEEGDDILTVSGGLPVLDAPGADTLVETVGAEAGRVAALLAGELPHDLVEHAEQAGVELLPYGSELVTRCGCEPWTDPCQHAVAVLQQLTWLIDDDPFVLLALRGMERDDLLSRLHAAGTEGGGDTDDLDVAAEAAQRAARLLQLLQEPGQPVDHLFRSGRLLGEGLSDDPAPARRRPSR